MVFKTHPNTYNFQIRSLKHKKSIIGLRNVIYIKNNANERFAIHHQCFQDI